MAAVISDNDNSLDGTNGEEDPSELEVVAEVVAETNCRNEMTSSIATLRASPKYSDFLILCGDHIFPAHKAIICSQSDFFAKVFDSHISEACTGRIRLHDHPRVVLLLLDYLYSSDYTFYLDYDFPTSFLAEGQSPPGDLVDRLHCCELSVHIHVFLVADRLLIKAIWIYDPAWEALVNYQRLRPYIRSPLTAYHKHVNHSACHLHQSTCHEAKQATETTD